MHIKRDTVLLEQFLLIGCPSMNRLIACSLWGCSSLGCSKFIFRNVFRRGRTRRRTLQRLPRSKSIALSGLPQQGIRSFVRSLAHLSVSRSLVGLLFTRRSHVRSLARRSCSLVRSIAHCARFLTEMILNFLKEVQCPYVSR